MKTTVKTKIVAYVVSAILIVFCLFPIYWMLITSLKTSTEIYKIVPTFWPKKLTFEGLIPTCLVGQTMLQSSCTKDTPKG